MRQSATEPQIVAISSLVEESVIPAIPGERVCIVCRRPGVARNAIVHRGRCARVRKTQLQRLARWRARR